jgi:hypothetical protein
VNANTNYPLLPQLPKRKYKKKWQEIVKKAKLFLQRQDFGIHPARCALPKIQNSFVPSPHLKAKKHFITHRS